jgi:enoyl-CoA hydratase/carnithine racemase
MAEELILIDRARPLARITMNWVAKRNALSLQMMSALTRALEELGADPDVQAIVLAANGPVFSAGHDLSEMVGKDIAQQRRVFDLCVELMTTVQEIRPPVVAEVQGMATAAGCQLVATCDLAVAAEAARFATPGVRIGLFCTTPMVALTRAIGSKRALEMLLTGEPIDARTALDWGLVNRVVTPERLREETEALALRIAEASPFVVGLGKQAFYAQIDLDRDKAYSYAKEVMSLNAVAADAQEGMSAFLEKRKPSWVGR